MSWPEFVLKEMRKDQLEKAEKRGLLRKEAVEAVDILIEKIRHDSYHDEM